ncbi:MAG: hypothetical protein KatS3mg007_2341 [Thermoanaerobaculum sp.]|nr:MAG: hypothetical protein KatS3mg007_2341 [Thermoanaerobaculum sp.]
MKAASLTLALGLAVPALWGGELRLAPISLEAVCPVTETSQCAPVAVTPLSPTRFLALFKETRFAPMKSVESPSPNPQQPTSLKARREKIEIRGGRYFLAFLTKDGRATHRSADHPELAGLAPGTVAGWQGSRPDLFVFLVAPEVDFCPYGLLRSDTRKLLCFDWSLGFLRAIDLPVDLVTGGALVLEDEGTQLWVFGKAFKGGVQEGSPIEKLEALFTGPVPALTGLGVRVSLRDGQVRPLPVTVSELFAAVSKVARDARGEPCRLQRDTLELVPILSLSADTKAALLVTGACTEKLEGAQRFRGERVFLRATLTPSGLSGVKQARLFLIQDESVEMKNPGRGWERDQEDGVVRVRSRRVALSALRAFELRNGSWGLFGQVLKADDEDPNGASVFELFARVSPAGVAEFLTRSAARAQNEAPPGTMRLPFFAGTMGEGRLAFLGRCRPKDDVVNDNCLVVLDVAP